jgi:hypothetical protein
MSRHLKVAFAGAFVSGLNGGLALGAAIVGEWLVVATCGTSAIAAGCVVMGNLPERPSPSQEPKP